MNKLIIVGTDTDVGKTTVSALLLHHLGDRGAYWKPLETGVSDTETIRKLIPNAEIHPPYVHYVKAMAPEPAAWAEDKEAPLLNEILQSQPHTDREILLIETFGSPFSPINYLELQLQLIQQLDCPCILVASTTIGVMGRTLQTLAALKAHGIVPEHVILIGEEDSYNQFVISSHSTVNLILLQAPEKWSSDDFKHSAKLQAERLRIACSTVTNYDNINYWIPLDRSSIWHPYTSLVEKSDPLVVLSARDEYLQLGNGERIIDAISSWWTILHGHSHPKLVEAIHSASATLDHVIFARTTHRDAISLARCLLSTMPWDNGKVFYSDNGSTAVEVALKMALQYWRLKGETQRTLFVSFENGYHGDTFGAMSVGRDPLFFKHFEPLLFETKQIPIDANQLDELLTTQGHRVAAVIIEPLVQGAGGMRMHSPQTLTQLYEVAKKHHVLFIADEVMTANRTGKRWAFQHSEAVPDLVCASKTLAGGMMPLAATMIAPHIVEVFNHPDAEHTFFHGHSFTGHALACAVAVANERLLSSGAIYHRTVEIEAYYHHELDALRDHANVRDVRICGSIAAIELNVEGGYLANVGERIRQQSLQQGVLLRPLGNVVYTMPPLGIRDKSLQQVVATMKSVIK